MTIAAVVVVEEIRTLEGDCGVACGPLLDAQVCDDAHRRRLTVIPQVEGVKRRWDKRVDGGVVANADPPRPAWRVWNEMAQERRLASAADWSKRGQRAVELDLARRFRVVVRQPVAVGPVHALRVWVLTRKVERRKRSHARRGNRRRKSR